MTEHSSSPQPKDPINEKDTQVEEDLKAEEGLQLLLGGLNTTDITSTAWDEESIPSCSSNEAADGTAKTILATASEKDVSAAATSTSNGAIKNEYEELPGNCNHIYKFAHTCLSGGRIGRPENVQVVSMTNKGRGNGLIATQFIPKGSVIFTERAPIATQVPVMGGSNVVRACEHCFRSLEPVHSLQENEQNKLPMPHLWPVPPLVFEQQQSTAGELVKVDKFGRLSCRSCEALFCSSKCHDEHSIQQGSCCAVSKIFQALPSLLQDEDDGDYYQVQSAVVLAIRMFGCSLQHFRRTSTTNHITDNEMVIGCLDSLCGKATDLTPLEIELPEIVIEDDHQQQQHTRRCFTLKPVYNQMVEAWSMTDSERQALPLECFHKLAAMAARNGVGIMTQSPFRVYYTSLLAATGGRGSDRHERIKTEVAMALGSDAGKLERGMDRLVEEKVAVEVAALFPLTARINHSCVPNAQIQSQQFVDCHMDLVALQDIRRGEEITISYIATGRKSRYRRRRELAAKYLFHCTCAECSGENEPS